MTPGDAARLDREGPLRQKEEDDKVHEDKSLARESNTGVPPLGTAGTTSVVASVSKNEYENRSPDGDGHRKCEDDGVTTAQPDPRVGPGAGRSSGLQATSALEAAYCGVKGTDDERSALTAEGLIAGSEPADSLSSSPDVSPARTAAAGVNWEREARLALWANHGCDDFTALYGDDGEMQCHKCQHDFLREDWVPLTQFSLVQKAANQPASRPPPPSAPPQFTMKELQLIESELSDNAHAYASNEDADVRDGAADVRAVARKAAIAWRDAVPPPAPPAPQEEK